MAAFFNDTCTEASTTAATSHTTDSGGTYLAWGSGTTPGPVISPSIGGVMASGANGTQCVRSSVISPTPDTETGGQTYFGAYGGFTVFGCMARMDSAGNTGYMAAYSSGTKQWGIYRVAAGFATTQLGSLSAVQNYTAAQTPVVKFTVTGSGATVTLVLNVDGSDLITTTDTSGSRIVAAGYVGAWFNCLASQGMFWGTFYGDTPSAGSSYTITGPAAGQVCALSGVTTGNATVNLTGTYTGTAPNQWRVVQDGTSTPVSGLDWQSFSVAPSAGAFSQAITVPKQTGWLNVQVRDSVGGTSQVSGKVGTGVLVAVDGQSWAYLWFSNTAYAGDSSLTPEARLRITGIQPAGAWNVPATATMNAAIACGNRLIATLNCPVALIDGSWDGSGLTVTANGGRWINGGVGANAYTASAAAVAAAGTPAATIWIQGQADAGSAVSQSTYYTALGQLMGLRRTAVGNANLPYIVVTHPRNTASLTDANVQAIRNAHIQACGDANVYRVDVNDVPLYTDGTHATAPGQTTEGDRCAQAVLAALGLVTYYRGPRIASAQRISAQVYDVNLTHSGGTDFTPSSGITGFRVLDGATPVTVSSAVRQSASVVRLTLASDPAAAPVIQYMYGAAPSISAPLFDNSALVLPLEANNGVTANDATPPTLTSPTGTQTGSTTASGAVSTDTGDGTLYFLASTNATESAATVKAAGSQTVTGTGSQAVNFTGLSPSTVYYAHYVHRSALGADSAVANSASFTTAAGSGGTITTPPLKNNTGTVLANETGAVANIYNVSTGVLVVRKTGQSTNGSGVMVITDPLIVASTSYAVEIVLASNGRRLPVLSAA